MKAVLKSTSGENKGHVELPSQFHEPVRPDLIKRAVLSIQSHKRQPFGTDPEAGKKVSSKISRRRRNYKGAYGHGISRVPRKILSHSGTRFNWQAAEVPSVVGGRQAHPPKVTKIWDRKMNNKERRKAIRSAMAASVDKALVVARGHKVTEYPIVLDDAVESFKKSKEILDLFTKLGLDDEMERASKKTMVTGVGRTRGRTSKKRKGPLLVVSKSCDLYKAARNVPGVDIVIVDSLNAELLAPGCDCGRLTLYTKGAIDKLEKSNLFFENASEAKPVKESEAEEKPVKKAVKKVAAEEKPKKKAKSKEEKTE